MTDAGWFPGLCVVGVVGVVGSFLPNAGKLSVGCAPTLN